MKKLLIACTLLLAACTQNPITDSSILPDPEIAQQYGERWTQQNPQSPVLSIASFSDSFLTQLTGNKKYRGLSSEEVILSMRIAPDFWQQEPLFYITNRKLQKKLGLKTDRTSYAQLYAKDSLIRNLNYSQEIKLDEQYAAAHYQLTGQYMLFQRYSQEDPFGKGRTSSAPNKIRQFAETLTLAYKPFTALGRIYITFGLSMIIMSLLYITKGKNLKKYTRIAFAHLLAFAIVHFIFLVLRLIVLQRSPFATGYETLLLTSCLSIAIGLRYLKKSLFVLGSASIFAGIIMFIANSYPDHSFFILDPNALSITHIIQASALVLAGSCIGLNACMGILSNAILFFANPTNRPQVTKNIQLHITTAKLINRNAIIFLTISITTSMLAEFLNGNTSIAYQGIRLWALLLTALCLGYTAVSRMQCSMPNTYQALIFLAATLGYYHLSKLFNTNHFLSEPNLLFFFPIFQFSLLAILVLYLTNASKWRALLQQ